jgi:hypothetical protein
MWIRLDDAERNHLLTLVSDGPLAEKLREQADLDAHAFMAAVQVDDELELDPDAVVSRGDDGAFVMTWTWVSNAEAFIEAVDYDDEVDSAELAVPLGR